MLGRFLGNTIAAVAANVNITYGGALGKIIEYAIVAFVVVLAISTLGVDTTGLTSSLTIIIAAAGLAVALTFAFGSREAALNVIAGYYVRQDFQNGQTLTVDTYTGRFVTIAGAYTTLEIVNADGERSTLSLPNTLLLKHAVAGLENPPATTNDQQEDQHTQQP